MAEWINDPQGREEIEKVTKELKLPVWKANHKGKFRDFWNELWDKIEDYILKLKRDTEKNSKGLNDRLISAIGKHDGDFPIANAVVGNVYYSELTKKYYKCKIGGPAPMPNGNFIDMSILENLNRLENLIKVKTYRLDKANDIMTLQTSAGTYVICEKRIENFKKAIGIPDSATIISTTSAQNHGYLEYCTYNYDGDYAYIGMLVHTDNPRWVVINIAYVL